MPWGDVKKIKIQNEIFTDPLCLQWYTENNKKKEPKSVGTSVKEIRNILIYGKNGSGKTSISRSISQINQMDRASDGTLYGKDGKQIRWDDPLKRNVFVFNEDYIDKNIRISEKGLQPIVVFGKQIELDDQIQELSKEIEIEIDNQDQIEKKKSELEKRKKEAHEAILQRLKQEGGWVDRANAIKRGNIHVTDNGISRIMSCKRDVSIEDINVQYKKSMKQLNNAKENVEIPKGPINIESIPRIDEENIVQLINRTVKRPVLEEQEKHIIDLLRLTESQQLYAIKGTFQNEHTEYCPFCFRPISSAEKRELVEEIEKLLTNELEQYIQKLKKAKLNKLDLDVLPYGVINEDLVIKIRGKIFEINQKIQKYNQLLEEKEKDIFQNVDCSNMDLRGDFNELIQRLNQLNGEWAAYQTEINDTENLRAKLLELNNMMGKEEIKDLYGNYINEKKKYDDVNQKLTEIIEKIKKIGENIEVLKAKKKSFDVALNELNNKLYRVFLSRNRLQVEVKGEEFHLLVRGEAVQPKQISTGERNLLALCYFFTELARDRNQGEVYNRELFLCIDDPISSFDQENRIGIMSLLLQEITALSVQNRNSKCLLLTHDALAYYDLRNMLESVKKAGEQTWGKDSTNFLSLELSQGQLLLMTKKYNVYNWLIQKTYDYAIGSKEEAQEMDEYIGNIIRRLMETFCTFSYKMGMSDLARHDEILNSITDDGLRQYYKNFMYQLMLNGESHMEEQIRGLPDRGQFMFESAEEKHKIAKGILCLICLLNEQHLRAHLGDAKKFNLVNQWIKDMKMEIGSTK